VDDKLVKLVIIYCAKSCYRIGKKN